MTGGLLFLAASLTTGSLQVEAESPQSLCPPEEETSRAIAARIGSVKGAEYLVHYGLVQDATLRTTVLRILLLRDGEPVLERELRVDETDCPHLASVIALIVASYFDEQNANAKPTPPASGFDSPAEGQTPVPPLPPTARLTTGPPSAAPSREDSPTDDAPQAPSVPPSSKRPFLLRWGAGAGSAPWGTSLLLGARWDNTWWSHLQVDLLLRPAISALQQGPYELEVIRQEAHLGAGVHTVPVGGISFGITPLAGAAIESVRLAGSVGEGNGPKLRVVGSFGGAASAQWAFHDRWVLGLSTRFRVLAGGRPFLVTLGEGTYDQVLSFPQYLTDFSLYLGVTL